MATIRFLLCFIFLATAFKPAVPDRHLLRQSNQNVRQKIVRIATAEVGVKETGYSNRGIRVEEYLRYVSLKGGQPWCAAYVSWVFGQAGFAKPRSGWSPDLFPSSRLARSALPANLIGIYFSELKRIAHVGIVVRQDGDWIVSVEGNTNDNGSRDGDGVYVRRRHARTIKQFADWTDGERRLP